MDLSVTNTWLAVGAISLAVMALAVVAAFVVLMRVAGAVTEAATQAKDTIARVSQQVTPLAAQTSALLGDVHDLVQQLRHADEVTTAAFERLADRWRRAAALARSGFWPALAVARGAAAVVQWIAGRQESKEADVDRAADARFTYEGGGTPIRSAGR